MSRATFPFGSSIKHIAQNHNVALRDERFRQACAAEKERMSTNVTERLPVSEPTSFRIHPIWLAFVALLALTVGLCCGMKIGYAKAQQAVEGVHHVRN